MAITDHPAKLAAVCCGCTSVIFIIVMVTSSYDTLEPEAMGLHYNTLEETVQDDNGQAFKEGRYFLGLGSRFIKFPATVQTIEFTSPPLQSRTSDGLGVRIEISFQYQLDPFTLLDLYKKFGDEYGEIFTRISTNVLKVAATQYSASNFFSNRTTIGPLMEGELRQKFVDLGLNAKMPGFQLSSVHLPEDFEASIRETQMQQQQVAILKAEQLTKKVEWETEFQKTVQRVDVKLNQARAEAAKSIVDAKAKSKADLVAAQTEANTRLLDAGAKAKALEVASKATAESLVLEATAAAEALLLEADAEAQGVTLQNDAYVKQYNLTQYLQAKSYVSMYQALGSNENHFLDYLELRALNNISWRDWTINFNDKQNTPFDLLSR